MGDAFVIDVWADVVCPFCYLGSRQLDLALAAFEHREEVVVRRHAYELNPRSPARFDKSLDELVADRYDMPVERARQFHARLEARAEELGMTWSFKDAKPANTFDAHRLIALAATQGLAGEISERLFRAYFSEGLLPSDRAQLSALAAEVGVGDADLLWATNAFACDVGADESSADQLGITGVPALLVNNKFMILGAQGVELMLDILNRAWSS